MAFYNLYRITDHDDPQMVGAGWDIKRVDEFNEKELSRDNFYPGKFIHRFIIPEDVASQVYFRVANDHSSWNDSAKNELKPLSDIVDNEVVTVAWEITFNEGLDLNDYYVKQETAKEITVPGHEWDLEPTMSKPKVLLMGEKVRAMMVQ